MEGFSRVRTRSRGHARRPRLTVRQIAAELRTGPLCTDLAPLNGSRSYVRVGPKGGPYATSASHHRTVCCQVGRSQNNQPAILPHTRLVATSIFFVLCNNRSLIARLLPTLAVRLSRGARKDRRDERDGSLSYLAGLCERQFDRAGVSD